MSKIQILDCTLRDGGYINDFRFSRRGIVKILKQLSVAGIDIVECGFLEDGEYDPECSVYTTVEQIRELLPADHGNTMFVAMACYGEYDLDQLSDYDGTSIEGIRVTFHYNEIDEALEYCRRIQQKGYKVFVQPVGTSSYSDEQLLSLIKSVNAMRPYAFYLVDTLGLMHKNEVIRFFYLIDHNLDKNIHMGFHSHNNLQLSYSNCQALASLETDRIISLDSSVYGMGRGAGNLNTELIANYLNEHQGKRYEIEPLLEIIDEYIINIKRQFEWGYAVPYYLAAINGCHPNYASYLSAKQTLTVKAISSILRMIEPEKRSLFNKELAEKIYIEYQSHEIDDAAAIERLRLEFKGHNVMILAPGPSINENIDKIKEVIARENCLVLAPSFVPERFDVDFVFLANMKRYETTFNPTGKKIRLIHTSNIRPETDDALMLNYSSLLNEDDLIRDNSSLMVLNLLGRLDANKIYIAGMDGYRTGGRNFYDNRLQLNQDEMHFNDLNRAISRRLKALRRDLDIEFITPSLYE